MLLGLTDQSLFVLPSQILERFDLNKILPLFSVSSILYGFKSLPSTPSLLNALR